MGIRHLLEIDDLSAGELAEVLVACRADPQPILAGKGVGLIFEKPSLRTRNSSEMAVVQLGGHPVMIRNDEIQLDVRETVEDITRVLAGYFGALGARVFKHRDVERMAAVSAVPVINMLSDEAHPCQAVADLLTIADRFGSLSGLTLAWVGDFNNVAHSLVLGALLCDMSVCVGSPPGFGPDDAFVERAALITRGRPHGLRVETRAQNCVKDAQVVVTDTWVSMGQEAEGEVRRRVFEGFTVDDEMMSQAAQEAVFLHCLPAHRGQEVTASVIDGPRSLVITEAHNRLDAFRGVLRWLLQG